MKRCGLILALAALLVGGAEPPSKPVSVTMAAVAATSEGRKEPYFDAGLEWVRSAVAELKYDTYRKVQSDQRLAPFQEETRFPINQSYTLCITPVSKESNGRIRLAARIEMPPKQEKQKPVAVLDTTICAVPGDKVKFRIPQDKGELIIVLRISE